MPARIRIAHLSTIYHTSFILMGTDWLERAGIRTDWKLYASGPDIVKAFASKEIDLAYIGLPPAIIGIDRGVPIICIAGGHVEGTVMVSGKRYGTLGELKDMNAVLSQFKGQVIGSPPEGSIHDVIIRNAIEEAGMDISVKNYPWTDFVLEALVDNEIHAAVGTPSLAVAASRACGAKIVIPPHALWKDNPSYGIVIRKDVMKYPEMLLGFLKAHEKASNLIRKKTARAANIVAGVSGIVDKEFVMEAYRVSPKYCAALSPGFVNSTMAFVPVLYRMKYISRHISEDEIFEHGFIDKVHSRLPHYDNF